MKDTLKYKIDKMDNIYDIVHKQYRWSVDELSFRFVSFLIALSDKEFNLEQYNDMIKFIKKKSGVFSYHRGTLMHPTAALMLTKYEKPQEAFLMLLENEKIMKEEGFKTSPYLGIAAHALLLTCPPELARERAQKSMEIYKIMKKNHFWLTGSDDYPVAVLLAGEENTEHMMSEMEVVYENLHRDGFTRSNGLQFLSHLLAFSDGAVSEKITKCKEIYDFFKGKGLRISPTYYGIIGFIALLGKQSTEALNEVLEAYNYLKSASNFKKSYRDMNLLIISALVSNEYVRGSKQSSITETGINVSIQAAIEAQTAALIAATSAVTIAASTTASN